MNVDLQRISLAAKQVGISKPTIYRAAKAGSIKLFKKPGMTFVSMAELQGWIAGVDPSAPPKGT